LNGERKLCSGSYMYHFYVTVSKNVLLFHSASLVEIDILRTAMRKLLSRSKEVHFIIFRETEK
jgi:hypothetical protein